MLSQSGTSPAAAAHAAASRSGAATKLVLAVLAAGVLLSSWGLYSRHANGAQHEPSGSVRIALLSDTHIAGPEYPLGKPHHTSRAGRKPHACGFFRRSRLVWLRGAYR